MPEIAYFDTCLFIELLQQDDKDRFEACEALRAKAEKNEIVIVTSTWTIVEVNKLEGSTALLQAQSKLILDFFENPYIALRPLDRRTASEAHELTRTHGLTNADAVHVATATINRCNVLYTYDAAKKKRRGLLRHNLKVGNPPLRIEKPPDPGSGTLFSAEVIEATKALNDAPSILQLPPVGTQSEAMNKAKPAS